MQGHIVVVRRCCKRVKNMKKGQRILAVLLSAAMIVSTLSGCKNQNTADSSQQSENSSGESVSEISSAESADKKRKG